MQKLLKSIVINRPNIRPTKHKDKMERSLKQNKVIIQIRRKKEVQPQCIQSQKEIVDGMLCCFT